MADLMLWRKSWTFPGVKLIAAGQECLSPKGDWRAFAAGAGRSASDHSAVGWSIGR